ncbi:MAG TPA: biotin attachment protein [Spirochaetota bacterium]|nr:biotin attachment protein [Spirochaetota bacterium]HPF06366.1 biotin attachment protein [Spirochaetota bacterium]HPJ43256.1 biotin attachment protein [Spirochaetota bacterium]HPR38881.1 biotin attachment protein [Spirochaetota bacterium]HRX48569.1 biotin attachment protein [Spirochaetota bacterium]
MSKKRIKFMCTAFRDGFQSVYGSRVFSKDYLPVVEAARDAGLSYFESGGGASFQSLFFYCRENAFDVMDAFRKAAGPDANLQTLARGVNVVGLDSQPADIIALHAKMFKKHGVTTIRNFDALNDVNNLIFSGKSIADAGLKHQVCVTMMELPPGCSGAHDPEFYMKTLRSILDAGIPYDSVCFKDASGTSAPSKVYETIKLARKMLPEGTVIDFHTHETAGIGVTCYKAAIEAGADFIDLSMAPVSGGTCQPDILTMWHALRGSEYDLDVDVEKVMGVEEFFQDSMKEYFLPPEAVRVDPLIPWSPMPGGALTANTQMLRDNNLMHKYNQIIKAMEEVVRRGGFGTSVTPVSQFYFQQAFNNVMFGPWEKIAEGYGKMVLGYYGKTPVEPDPEIVKISAEKLGMAPADNIPIEIDNSNPAKGMAPARNALKEAGLLETDENIFIAATCKEKGIAFLLGKGEMGVRKNEKEEVKASKTLSTGSSYTVSVNGKNYTVTLDHGKTIVNGKVYSTSIRESDKVNDPVQMASGTPDGTEIKAPLPGKVFKIISDIGDHVETGDTILILESMKMETRINSTVSGTVSELLVSEGDQVQTNDVLVLVS